MYIINADPEKNLLTLRLEGFMTDQELEKGAHEVMDKAKTLRTGFVIINDISKMKPATPQGTEHIRKAQAYVLSLGASKVIRVTDNPISKMQFSRTGSTAGYHAIEVKTIEEAMAMI